MPVLRASRQAFYSVLNWLEVGRPLILDSGCGSGHAAIAWAEDNPQARVLGVDQSLNRLRKSPVLPTNVQLIRARAEDIWRLLLCSGYAVQKHYLMYPNPWPKPGHLKRRWHGHPAFQVLVRLGGDLELRTNWKIYAEEFRLALQIYEIETSPVVPFRSETPASLFECKYVQSGHGLYRLTANLSKNTH